MCDKCIKKIFHGKCDEFEYKLSNYIKFIKNMPDEAWQDPVFQDHIHKISKLCNEILKLKSP